MTPRWMPMAAWAAVAAGAAAVGLTTVGTVREVVADEPVEVLSAADVNRILAQPDAQLDPIPTLAAAPTVPRAEPGGGAVAGASRAPARIPVQSGTRTRVRGQASVTNADDRPSTVGGDPQPLSDPTGGQLGANGTGAGTPVDGGSPAPSPLPSASGSPSGSASASPSPSVSGSPSADPSADPSASASPPPDPTTSPSPSASTSPVPSPSPSVSATLGVTPSATPAPSSSPTASPTSTSAAPPASGSPIALVPTGAASPLTAP